MLLYVSTCTKPTCSIIENIPVFVLCFGRQPGPSGESAILICLTRVCLLCLRVVSFSFFSSNEVPCVSHAIRITYASDTYVRWFHIFLLSDVYDLFQFVFNNHVCSPHLIVLSIINVRALSAYLVPVLILRCRFIYMLGQAKSG